MDLFQLENLIRENWYKIVRLSNERENEISFDGIFKALNIKNEEEKKRIKNNIHFLIFLKKNDYGNFVISHIENKKDEEVDEIIRKGPLSLINLDVPFIENIPRINEKKALFLLNKESRSCDKCSQFDKARNFCNFRKIQREPYYPSCRYIFKLYRKR